MRLMATAWLAVALAPVLVYGQAGVQRDSKRECAVCHLDWAASFDRPAGVLLMDRPAKPQAAEAPMCLGCHDGSVADSRRTVWLEHGHRMGQAPSDKVKIPADMPLEDGKMVCRTCHSAHAPGRGTPDFTNIVFVRTPKDGGHLCQSCHPQKAQGPQHGTHPLGKMPWSLPKELQREGARAGGEQNQNLTCQSCHMAHGPRADHLLVMGTESSQLCLSCHVKLKQEMWHEGSQEHPQNPPVKNDVQRQAIKAMGTRIGPGDKVICLSCHRMHDGHAGRYMLAQTLTDSKLCTACHPDRANVLGSTHDLRKTAPKDTNRLGQTPQQAGPCGACHSFHRYAREPKPAAADPRGLCVTCHPLRQDDHKGLGFGHLTALHKDKVPPDNKLTLYPGKTDPAISNMTCTTCHDPHLTDHKQFLRVSGDQLCASCHPGEVKTLAGKHDFTRRPELKNGRGASAEQTGKCGFCHAVHQSVGPVMWIGTGQAPRQPDQLCTECHREGGLAAKTPAARFSHPTGAKATASTKPAGGLPLFDKELHRTGGGGFVACSSCHEVHADGQKSAHMLRLGGGVSELCLACHPQQGAMAVGRHDSRGKGKWPGVKVENDLCAGCHKAHSNDSTSQLWTVGRQFEQQGTDAACVACHPNSDWAADPKTPRPGAMMHPRPVKGDAQLPLLADRDGNARLGCQTCHDPHASAQQPRMLRVAANAPSSEVCATCHTNTKAMAHGMHAPDVLKTRGDKDPTCAPCHAVHAVPNMQVQYLWTAGQADESAVLEERLCLSCHGDRGTATRRPQMVRHPDTLRGGVKLSSTRPAALAATTRPAAAGQVTCQTCHLSHGPLQPAAAAVAPMAQRRIVKPMLRPGVAMDYCASCHGMAASKLFLYFHQPAKRANLPKFEKNPQ